MDQLKADNAELQKTVADLKKGKKKADTDAKLAAAGFSDIGVEPTRIYTAQDAREFLSANGLDTSVVSDEMDGKFLSAFIRAVKPAH